MENKYEVPNILDRWSDKINDISNKNTKTAFLYKVKIIAEAKLAEFNFKILYNILPCNRNLYKWKITKTDQCEMCNCMDVIHHMLIDCCLAKYVWSYVKNICDVNISDEIMMFGVCNNIPLNTVITMVCYFLYKYWISG